MVICDPAFSLGVDPSGVEFKNERPSLGGHHIENIPFVSGGFSGSGDWDATYRSVFTVSGVNDGEGFNAYARVTDKAGNGPIYWSNSLNYQLVGVTCP